MKTKLLFALSGLIPLLLFCYYFQKYAIDFPFSDDYWTIIDNFWQAHVHKHTKSEPIYPYLFDANQEHVIAYTKGLSLVFYKIFKENFSLLPIMILGNLALFLTYLWFIYIFRKESKAPLRWLALIPLFGITLQSHENTFWSMAASQNFTVLLFCSLSLYFMLKSGLKNVILGAFFSVAGILTSSPALIMMAIICAFLIIQKRYKTLIFFTIIFGLSSYFHYLQIPHHAVSVEEKVDFLNIFRFVGAISHIQGNDFLNQNLPMLLGIFIAIATPVLYFWNQKISNQKLFFFGILVFVIIIGIGVSLKREEVLLSRYKIYSILGIMALIAVFYTVSSEQIREKVYPLLLTIAIFYQIITWLTYPYDVKKYHADRISDVFNKKENKALTAHFKLFCNNGYYEEIMAALKIKTPNVTEVEQISNFLENHNPKKIFELNKQSNDLKLNISSRIEKNQVNCIEKPIEVFGELPKKPEPNENYYLLMTSSEKHYLYPFFPERIGIFGKIFKKKNLNTPLSNTIYGQYIQPQTYRFSILKTENSKTELILLDKKNQITL